MVPRADQRGEFYEFCGMGTLEPVIGELAHKLASPRGFSDSVVGGLFRRAA